MIERHTIKNCRISTKKGCDFLNHTLPIELYISGYQFCSSGTHLENRLAKNDRGINPLDAACRDYDVAYSQNKDLKQNTDKILANEAQKQITAKDSTFGERAAALAVWAAMKVKTKINMSLKTKKKKNLMKK